MPTRKFTARSMALRLGLHPIQPGVVVPKLLQVRPGDLSCHQGIVVRDVGHGVVSTMLELNLQPLLELGHIEFPSTAGIFCGTLTVLNPLQ